MFEYQKALLSVGGTAEEFDQGLQLLTIGGWEVISFESLGQIKSFTWGYSVFMRREVPTISGHPLGSDADNEYHRATGEQVPKLRPFITSHSGGGEGELYVKVKVKTMDELHTAHDVVMNVFDPGLMQRVAAKAGVDLGGSLLPPLTEELTDGRIVQLRELQGLGKLSNSKLVLDVDKALAELQQRRAEPTSFVWTLEMYQVFEKIDVTRWGWPNMEQLINLWRALHKAAGYK